jgi:hypothetical protein
MQNLKMGSGGLCTNKKPNSIIVQPVDAKIECGLYVYATGLDGCAQGALQITAFQRETQIL